ncbi:MAG: hypothetical protein QM820_46645 [Minicystis sp.]
MASATSLHAAEDPGDRGEGGLALLDPAGEAEAHEDERSGERGGQREDVVVAVPAPIEHPQDLREGHALGADEPDRREEAGRPVEDDGRGDERPEEERVRGLTAEVIDLRDEADRREDGAVEDEDQDLGDRPAALGAPDGRGEAEQQGEIERQLEAGGDRLPVGGDDGHEPDRDRERAQAGDGIEQDRAPLGAGLVGEDTRGRLGVDEAGLAPRVELLLDLHARRLRLLTAGW